MSFFRAFLLAPLFYPVFAWPAQLMVAIPSGPVTVNGVAILRSSTVFPGDVVTTVTGSAVVLHSKGSSVQLGPAGKCVVRQNGILLASGTARVEGITEIAANDNLKIRSSAGSSFVVTRHNGNIEVTVLKGLISLQHGSASEDVKMGETRTFDESSTTPGAKTHSKSRALFVGIALSEATTMIIVSRLGDEPDCISSGGARCDFPSAATNR